MRTWRNDPATRASSFTAEEVGAADHARWFAATLARDDRHLLVVEADGTPAGVVRFDRLGPARWEISINLAPEQRGRGLGVAALRAGVDWLAGTEGEAVVVALVRPANEASLRAFQRAGFAVATAADDTVELHRATTIAPRP